MPRKELSLGAKSHLPPVFVNKVVLECNPANHLHIAYDCFLTKTAGESSSCDSEQMANKA